MKQIIFFLLFPAAVFSQNTDPKVPVCDILILNGKIIDGTGNNWYYGNIAVKNGKIMRTGRDINIPAKKIIDARGLIVAPGFIDVHTHLEDDETRDPKATSFI